ncbi:hypothetical protein GCM10011579_028520 [Streptomyces albiflavescens]|uniref:DUF3592 domain-containing protein n=1 Tax=Streptomyces albiflavescens TaxID=1623582 RepID=A0A918D3K9_9ACTN|nr:DUF3592 domain-containing protein [Streptomyces albiflavescens]GGN61843.1 hypothetical protein GCM10011579_028520 [Streptomyces albiflavescens]
MGKTLLALVLLGGLGASFSTAAVHFFRAWQAGRRLKRCGAQSTAVCTHLQIHDNSVSLHFTYEVDGVEYHGTSSPISRTAVVPGTEISVLYDPLFPSNSDAAECMGQDSRAILFIALLLGPVGLALDLVAAAILISLTLG